MDSSKFLDLVGLTRFKEKLLELVEKALSGKQDAGEYLTEESAVEKGFVQGHAYGEVRDRDESKPTYGLV